MTTAILPVCRATASGLAWVMLPDGTVRRPFNVVDLCGWQEMGHYVIGRATVGDAEVKTDFIGIDHAPLGWPGDFLIRAPDGWPRLDLPPDYVPTCFETMIFGGPFHDHKWRCRTLPEARMIHAKVVCKLQRSERRRSRG